MSSVVEALRDLAARVPEQIVLAAPDCAVSAAGLLARAQRLAGQLQQARAGVVGLLCDNSIDWAVADLACQYAGLCMVPIPVFFSAAQMRHVLDSASVDTLLFDSPNATRVTALLGEGSNGRLSAAPSLQLRRLQHLNRTPMPATTAKLTFTSGSTGNPKGVCLSTQQCHRVAGSLATAVAEDSPRHLCVLPLSTLLENIGGLYMPILSGGTSLVYPLESLGMAGSSGVQPQRFLRAIEALQPTTMILVPQLLALLDGAIAGGWPVPACLRFVAVGGGRVASAVVPRVRAAGLPVYEGYGLSECASVVALNTRECDRPGSSGKVLPHVSLSEENGELVVSGNSFLGYLNDPSSWGKERIYTGDLGRVDDDGFVTVTGRCKNVLVSSFGRNISPEWVESELLATGVFTQVMLLGDGRAYCSALVVAAPGQNDNGTLQSAIDQVNATLPDYARVANWAQLATPFSVSDGTLTDNGRLRREHILHRYAHEIEHLYPPQQEPIAL